MGRTHARPGAASDAMRLRLLLGQRGGETAGMLWKEVDLETATWTLPRPRTKTKQPHVVGLPPTALALLERRRAASDEQEKNVFPGLTLTCEAHKALYAIHDGVYEWKDLRRTVGTRLAGLRIRRDRDRPRLEPREGHGHQQALQQAPIYRRDSRGAHRLGRRTPAHPEARTEGADARPADAFAPVTGAPRVPAAGLMIYRRFA